MSDWLDSGRAVHVIKDHRSAQIFSYDLMSGLSSLKGEDLRETVNTKIDRNRVREAR